MKLVPIKSKKYFKYTGKVYDLEVELDHTYNVNGIIVHNSDYIILGSILNKALESAGDTFTENVKHETWTQPGEQVDQFSKEVKVAFENGLPLYKKYSGMSTKAIQEKLGNQTIRTSEGVTRIQTVEYTISGWVENFKHYLSSAMSYTNSKNLSEFIGKVEWMLITQNSLNRFQK